MCMHVLHIINFITHRNDLLVYAESSDAELLMLLKVIDLLASCAEGENLFIESICQNVIGIPELLWVIHACIHVYYMCTYDIHFLDFVDARP